MKELLEKLKSLDPTTWNRWANGLIGSDGLGITTQWTPLSMAWLQAVLQEAISGKSWHWLLEDSDPSIRTGISGFVCDICDKNYDVLARYVQGDTPTKALLAAYIAACEAKT